MINLTIGGTTKRSNNGQTTVEIDWENLPGDSRDFIVTYGLKQYLADGAAGAASHDELVQGVAERVRKLQEADFRRASGEPKADSAMTLALRQARAVLKAKAGDAFKSLPKEKVDAAVKAMVERDPAFLKEAQAEIARRAKAVDAFTGDDLIQNLLADMAGQVEATEGAE